MHNLWWFELMRGNGSEDQCPNVSLP